MIPLRLTLSNFLCYRENVPALDFAGIHVACLCGANGHGKSALLDAITWCLWGKARAKTHDELISYGADQTNVELEFLARNTKYRVARSHARGGGNRRQGTTGLELQVISDSGPTPITGNHLRETQAKIDQIIGMDYDTFTNSAFLLQGRADEFTNKTPSERKAVLSKILGLEMYDRLQDKAKVRLADRTETLGELEGGLGEMRRQVEEIGHPAPQLAEVTLQLIQLDQELEQRRAENADLKGKVDELERQHSQLEEVGQSIDNLGVEVAQLENAAHGYQNRVLELKDLLTQGEEIRLGAENLEQAQRRYEELEQARQTHDGLAQTKAELTRIIDSAKARLGAQEEALRSKVEVELPAKARAGPELAEQLAQVRLKLGALEEEDRAIALQRDDHLTLSTRVGEAKSVALRYKEEGQELRSKLDLLQTSSHEEAICPLCKSPLGADGCGRLAETYDADIIEKIRLYRLNEEQLKRLEADKTNLEQQLARREEAASGSRRSEEARSHTLERGLEEAQQAQQELEQARSQLTGIQSSLASGDFAHDQLSQQTSLEREIEALGYDEAARSKSYSQVQELQPFADRLRQLADAEGSLAREEEAAAQNGEMLRRRREELERLEERRRAGQEAVVSLPQWQAKLKESESLRRTVELQQQDAIAKRGFLDGQLQRLESLNQEIAKGASQLSGIKDDQGIYQELVTAFGRQGVQAMLIETVVPLLEEETNRILGRMTDNRMHIRLETQRERRTGRGDPIETLEIQVSDELGPRSYEMYSGGEAFRVNLSLRIALSKVLAQRMGAPLPTLFIDEGFGTQDAAGRERILDVIAGIQDDFDKIIVITHLDELKDSFPVRIEVQKGAEGSTFWLS